MARPTTKSSLADDDSNDSSTMASDVESANTSRSTTKRKRTCVVGAAALILVIVVAAVTLSLFFTRDKETASAISSVTVADGENSAPTESGEVVSSDGNAVIPEQEQLDKKSTIMDESDVLGKILDFSSLERGTYVTDQFSVGFEGVTVEAVADARTGSLIMQEYNRTGYTPGLAARVFDTSHPVDRKAGGRIEGDFDLGSPHQSCGGPGRGEGGQKGSPYENCQPLGNVLIIQDEDKPTPDDYSGGGTIAFRFDRPVTMQEVALFSITCGEHAIVSVTNVNGKIVMKQQTPDCLGMNSVYKMPVHVPDATVVQVYLSASGAVASLKYQIP